MGAAPVRFRTVAETEVAVQYSPMPTLDPQFAKWRATFTGASVGVGLAGTAGLIFLGLSAAATPIHVDRGVSPAAVVLTAIPAVLAIGFLIALPLSALLVITMAALAKRWQPFDHPVIWCAAGALLSAPIAWGVHQFDAPYSSFEFTGATTAMLAIGGCSAFCAWAVRRKSSTPSG